MTDDLRNGLESFYDIHTEHVIARIPAIRRADTAVLNGLGVTSENAKSRILSDA